MGHGQRHHLVVRQEGLERDDDGVTGRETGGDGGRRNDPRGLMGLDICLYLCDAATYSATINQITLLN